MSTAFQNRMSWATGVDLAACTHDGPLMPSVVGHLARLLRPPTGLCAR